MPYKSFESDRLYIIPTLEDDADLILKLLNTPKFIKYVGDRNVKSIEEATDYIKEKMIPQLEKLGYSNYTLVKKSNNLKIGTCGLYNREGMEGVDIGFALLPEFEEQGFGYESAEVIKEAAFNEFGIEQLKGITTKDNLASQNLLLKLGMTLNGTVKLPDDTEELLLYELNFLTT